MPRLVCCYQKVKNMRSNVRPLLTSPVLHLALDSPPSLSDTRLEQLSHPQCHILPDQILNTPVWYSANGSTSPISLPSSSSSSSNQIALNVRALNYESKTLVFGGGTWVEPDAARRGQHATAQSDLKCQGLSDGASGAACATWRRPGQTSAPAQMPVETSWRARRGAGLVFVLCVSANNQLARSVSCTTALLVHSGHQILKTENQTEFTKNRMKFTEIKKFGSLFGT